MLWTARKGGGVQEGQTVSVVGAQQGAVPAIVKHTLPIPSE